MMTAPWKEHPLRSLIKTYIGGGWGKEEFSDEFSEFGAVIRGTDMPALKTGSSTTSAPQRFHKKSNIKSRKLSVGDLVIEVSGGSKNQPVGRSLLIENKVLRKLPSPVIPASFCKKITPNEAVVAPEFLYYFLELIYQDRRITQWEVQSTGIANFQFEAFLDECSIMLPEMRVQKRIASVLSTYDDLIENNTRRIEILEEMARRLYEEWFVHFRFPGHEEVSFKESELGEIPEGWKPVAFSEVASFMNGFAFKPSHFTDDGLPVIKIKELKSGVTADTPRCSGEVKEKYLVKDGDVLFSWSAHLDAYIWRGGEGWLNQHLFKVDGVDGIPKSFLYFSLKEKMVDFRAKSMGTTMQHIKRSALNEVKFPMAAESLTSKFDDLVTPILNQVLLLQRKNGNLRAQRDLLLPKLVSGEIDVSNIPMPDDKEVEAA